MCCLPKSVLVANVEVDAIYHRYDCRGDSSVPQLPSDIRTDHVEHLQDSSPENTKNGQALLQGDP